MQTRTTNNQTPKRHSVPAQRFLQNPSTSRRFRSRLAFSVAMVTAVVAPTFFGSTFAGHTLLRPAFAQAQPVQAQAQPVTNAEKLLRQRLNKATAAYNAAASEVSRYPVFGVMGDIEGGNEQNALIYGQAIGLPTTSTNAMGWATSKRFLTVRNYRRSDVHTSQLYGTYVAVSQTVYAPPPASYYKAVEVKEKCAAILAAIQGELGVFEAKRQQERQRIAKAQQVKSRAKAQELAREQQASRQRAQVAEAQQLIAQFQAGYAKAAVTSNDADFLQAYGEAARSYYQSLVSKSPGSADAGLYEPLRETAIVQLVKAATIRAKAGALEASGELLKSSLWWSDGEVPLREAEIYRAQDFGAPALFVLQRQSALLGPLMAAWGETLPSYGERASYSQLVKARKLAEVLARSAERFNMPQRRVLLAALKPKDTGEADTPENPETLTETPEAMTPPKSEPKVMARRPSLDFGFRSMTSGRSFRLSDFRGKVVVLLLGEFAADDEAFGPSRIERFFEFSKGYDASQVVFLCVIADLKSDYYRELLQPRLDRSRAQSGRAVRKYPELYAINSTGLGQESAVFDFYNGRGERYSGNRVIVLDGQGQIVDTSDFALNSQQTVQRANEDRRGQYTRQVMVYDFDKDALDAQIIEALLTE